MTMNLGLIGVGRHGTRYAQHLLDPDSPGRLVAICRRDAAKGQAFAQNSALRFHQDYQSLIQDPEVEAIIVVAPPSLTLPIAITAIQNGKPLLIEKPLAVSGSDARQIVARASQAHVPIMTAHTLRYDVTIAKIKEWEQDIGEWQHLSLTARLEHRPHSQEDNKAWNNRGALLEIGIHVLDLTRFLTGEEIGEVQCETNQSTPQLPEGHAWGRLTTESGLSCHFDVSRLNDSRMTEIKVIGQTGSIYANWSTSTITRHLQNNTSEKLQLSPLPTIPLVINDFIQALYTETAMPISAEDGLRAVEIAEACYQSAAQKHTITLHR
ncbi:MAG: NADH-dependent dehydrogenase [Nitrospirales bacterium]|nr:MAG: NADH-dependent dehydrogenase [Nitrospirales bacterium]